MRNKEKVYPEDYSGDGSAEDILSWTFDTFGEGVKMACSFQHTVLIHMALTINPKMKLFSIDTGRLPEETYRCAQAIERRFEVNIEWYHPVTETLETLTRGKGQFSFKESTEARKECCAIRKIEPMNRALESLDAWITGLRRDHGGHRENVAKIQIDHTHGGLIKICPLADWTEEQILDYSKRNNLPKNTLLDKGYTSIGCECCTRPVQPGEDIRAGRWWWEEDEHKECGLHIPNWQI